MIELRHVDATTLHDYWPTILPGVLEIKRKTPTADPWIPEDVYSHIRSGQAALHVGFVDGHYVGFIVLCAIRDWNGLRAHVWLMYHAGAGDFMESFGEQFDALVRASGARSVSFYSPRVGWERRLKAHGFEPVQIMFRKEL